jgi:hypothetical protein
MKRLVLICLLVVFITGCLPWVRTSGYHAEPTLNVSAELPYGWMRHNTTDYLFITRDGPMLQYIMVESIHVEDELKHTKKKFKKGMMPQEQAEVILDNTGSSEEVRNLKVKWNKPTKLNGRKAFKVLFTYQDEDGLQYQSLYYGFMEGDWFYGIRYNAPERYYFDKELKTFKDVLMSVKLLA